jgi:hypothetical protein
MSGDACFPLWSHEARAEYMQVGLAVSILLQNIVYKVINPYLTVFSQGVCPLGDTASIVYKRSYLH